jgi:hypothetical protein
MVTTAPSPAFRLRVNRIVREQDAQDVARIRGMRKFPAFSWSTPKACRNGHTGEMVTRTSRNGKTTVRCRACHREQDRRRRLNPTRAADDP